VIAVRSLSKTYAGSAGTVPVLNDLCLEVAAGEFVAVMGRSGAGKSTLLQILGCLDQPSGGSYRFDGRETAGLGEEERAALRNRAIGFVFQTSHFVEYLDLLDNVALAGFYRPDYAPAAARERAGALLARVGLEDRSRHRPAELSGGERQRAALARALFNDPRLVLADEPTGNLDEDNMLRLGAVLGDLHRGGITVLMVTHDPDLAALAPRRLRLAGGRLEELAS
jgi:putative ABC transport system ATP-binding protein